MFMNINDSLFARPVAKAGLLLAGLMTAATFLLSFQAMMAPPAQATDLDVSAAENDGRFVRIGLNKSIVVKLPADARDVIVGNPDIVDAVVRSKNTAYLFARKAGQTNVFFFDAEGQQILNLDLEVSVDITGLRKLINRSLPGNRIKIDMVGANVVLSGVARNALEARTAMDLANKYSANVGASGASTQDINTTISTMIVEGEDQVMLKVKVVEIQRSVMKQFGVDMAALISAGAFAFNLASKPMLGNVMNAESGAAVSYDKGNVTFDSVIRAMEGDGLVRTLAEPNLTALTGQTASFHAGGQFAAGSSCTSTNNTSNCAPEFKDYGVQVDFSPTVLSNDRIILKIKTDVSDLGDITVGGIPSLNSRSAETTLEMPSGGSMMIAGLISQNTRQSLDATPGLKQLPVLGSLFRSRDFQSNETELVIIVTPVLVRPTGESRLTTPDEGFNPPTDWQMVFMGNLNKVYGRNGVPHSGNYHGNVGFIVE